MTQLAKQTLTLANFELINDSNLPRIDLLKVTGSYGSVWLPDARLMVVDNAADPRSECEPKISFINNANLVTR